MINCDISKSILSNSKNKNKKFYQGEFNWAQPENAWKTRRSWTVKLGLDHAHKILCFGPHKVPCYLTQQCFPYAITFLPFIN